MFFDREAFERNSRSGFLENSDYKQNLSTVLKINIFFQLSVFCFGGEGGEFEPFSTKTAEHVNF